MKDQGKKIGFTYFLNRNYYIHSHLAERLDEIKGVILFASFHHIITDTIARLNFQIGKFDQLFKLLGVATSYTDCEPLINFLESLFNPVQSQEDNDANISLLEYVSIADALMKGNSKIAELSISQMPQPNLMHDQLYDASILQALKDMLKQTFIIAN